MKSSFHTRSNRVLFFAKTKQDNDVTDCIGLVYSEIETELSRPIWLGVVYDENQIEKWHDWLYKCGIHRKQNLAIVFDQIDVIYDENQTGQQFD